MEIKGTRFSISKSKLKDSLVFVSCATFSHLDPKPRCTISFLSYFFTLNCTNIAQSLGLGIIVAFELRYKPKLVEHVLSQFDSYQQHNFQKVVPNIKQTIL